MACSSINTSNCKLFPLGESSFQQSQSIHYICVPTSEELKQKIYSAVGNLQLDSQNAVFQFWAAQKAGEAFVLAITNQPSGYSGNNEELLSYHNACLKHKLYVHPEKKVAFGLSGRAFLTGKPVQTQNVHDYPEDERPPSDDDAIFSRIWGSFAVPVIVDDQCVGGLEFVMDTPKDSYDSDIDKVCRALKSAGLDSSIQIELPLQNASLQTPIQNEQLPNTNNKKRRRTKSFEVTNYRSLVPYFGLTSDNAAAKLELKPGTFRNVCRRVGIPEWPWVPSTTPTDFYARINQAAASNASSSFQIPGAPEDRPCFSDHSFSAYLGGWTPCEQTAVPRVSVIETHHINEIDAGENWSIPRDVLEEITSHPGYLFSGMDMGIHERPCEQTTMPDDISVSEDQINQNAPDVDSYTNFGCPNFWIEDDEMNCQGWSWYGPIQSERPDVLGHRGLNNNPYTRPV